MLVTMNTLQRILFGGLLAVGVLVQAGEPKVAFHDDGRGQLQILVDGREALAYQYAPDLDMAHFYPVRSPSGKSMTVEQTEPYPHHRSFWFADTIQLEGNRQASTYFAINSKDPKDPKSPFKDHIRHVAFVPGKTEGNEGTIGMKLVWEMDRNVPMLDEQRLLRVVSLGEGEYFLDVTFTLTAAYGNVTFKSDNAHYAWPYIRINEQFNVEKGKATMTNSEGGVNQKQTHGKPAHWVDYSAPVADGFEGLAMFSHPSNGYPHTWLTRDYGTFGPRRVDAKNGKPFVLPKGESLVQRIGVLVHKGDVKTGRVAERYRQYVEDKIGP